MRNSNNIDRMEYITEVEEPDPGAEQPWARSTSSGTTISVEVPREGLDLGPGSMGPAIDHEGDDTGLDRDMVSNEKFLKGMEPNEKKPSLMDNGTGYATISTGSRYAFGAASSSRPG
ncbi:hypothetical protein ACOSQ2_003150 [Xanthoceras sorbifolium]